MFSLSKIRHMLRNKLRRSVVQSLIIFSAFTTFIILLIESGMEAADISLFRQAKIFATTKDGLVLANVPLSKLTDMEHAVATPVLTDDIDKACSIGARIRPLLSEIQFSNIWQVGKIMKLFNLVQIIWSR